MALEDVMAEMLAAKRRRFLQRAAFGRGRSGKLARKIMEGKNPVSIIVPCHRVVGSTGSLTGFAGGLDRKSWLLSHERRHAGQTLPLD